MMTAKSKFKGHEIEAIDSEWFFVESGKSVKQNHEKISCGHCGSRNTKEGHDGCLGVLPGVMNACCGHGQTKEAYIQFLDGFIVSGDSAAIIMTELMKTTSVRENAKPQ